MDDALDFDAFNGDSIFTGIFTTLKSKSFQCTLSSLISVYIVANKYVVGAFFHLCSSSDCWISYFCLQTNKKNYQLKQQSHDNES